MRIALLDYHKNPESGINLELTKIEKRLLKAGAEKIDIYRVLKGQLPKKFEIDRYGGFVLSGSDTYNLLDRYDAKKSLQIIEKADSLKRKILAFCGGFELLAVVGYGLKYEELEKGECGFSKINLTSEGRNDFMFSQIPDEYSVLGVHKRIIKDAKKYKVLAVNKNTGNVEAIRFTENVCGMFGHPEDTFEEAKEIIQYYASKNNLPLEKRLEIGNFLLNNSNIIFENFLKG